MPNISLTPASDRFFMVNRTRGIALLRAQQYGVREIAKRIGRHQYSNGEVILRLSVSAMALEDEARRALLSLFGTAGAHVSMLQSEDKTIQYTSNLKGAME
jgi:hypothetical protein